MIQNKSKDSIGQTLHHNGMFTKIVKTLNNTSKSDKYVRMMSNILKIVRTSSPQLKKKYEHFYKQLIILRQVIRWQGIYQAIIQVNNIEWRSLRWEDLSQLAFIGLGAFGDILDRFIFVLEILDEKKYEGMLTQIDHMQSDCYFIECIIWLFYHIRTAKQEFENGNPMSKRTKVLKIVKYFLDSITSYCKFSRRVWELQPKRAAVLGILSSLIGLYDILK